MRIILLHLTIMSLSVIKFTMARQMFLTLPEDEVARPGEPVTLKCVIDQLKGTCFWRLGGEVKAVQKFEAIGDSSRKYAWRNAGPGDCSLTIFRVTPDDEGIWTCDVGRSNQRLDDSLRADIYLSIGENCKSGYPCSKPAGRLTGRPARFTPKTWKGGRGHPFAAIMSKSKYWRRTPKPTVAVGPAIHPFYEGLQHRHYHHSHDFFGRRR